MKARVSSVRVTSGISAGTKLGKLRHRDPIELRECWRKPKLEGK